MLLALGSAKDPDDPEDFGFLDPDPQKYAYPRIRIQGAKYQPNCKKNVLLSKPKSELLKKIESIKIFNSQCHSCHREEFCILISGKINIEIIKVLLMTVSFR